MLAQGGDDHLAREIEKAFVERAGEGVGPLEHEVVDAQQPRVRDDAAARTGRELLDLFGGDQPARPMIGEHVLALEYLEVPGRAAGRDRAGRQEAMAARLTSRL